MNSIDDRIRKAKEKVEKLRKQNDLFDTNVYQRAADGFSKKKDYYPFRESDKKEALVPVTMRIHDRITKNTVGRKNDEGKSVVFCSAT